MTDTQTNLQNAFEIMSARIGEEREPTQWFEITQDRVNAFADVTMDHQWIHVDPERAAQGPFGAPIAHGALTLSIMSFLPRDEGGGLPQLPGQKLTINYGFDKVRFPSPVPVGSRIRTRSTLKRVEIKGTMLETMNEVVVEVEGSAKPSIVAESLARLVF